jgi:hypothetical protein
MDAANRIVCHFSCGAASAVATKLILARFDRSRVVIFNAFLQEEHPDNARFRTECEQWFNHPITVLRDEKYGASVDEVWARKRFIKSRFGAACSQELKHLVIEAACLPNDTHVFGFTVEEEDRAANFLSTGALCPLIDANLTKADCLAMVERAGIALPAMYLLGFNNNNCIGCCKGGEGYWNKIRVVFPARFVQVTRIQEDIGPGSYFFRDRKTGVRFGLKDLRPDAGRHDEPLPDCSFFCQMAESEFE